MPLSIGTVEFDEKWLTRQLKRDLKDDWFPDPCAYGDMVGSALLIKTISENFATNQGRYVASESTLYNLPKPNFTLRYALEMTLQDRMLYQGVVAYLMPFFDPCLDWKVFSHRYGPADSRGRTLFKPIVESWKNFNGSVREAIAPGSVLVTTDIANYYEHIETGKLTDTFHNLLPEVKTTPDQKSRLRECLQRLSEWLSIWCFTPSRGLPQNRDASSFLANIYMVPVDRAVISTGNQYFRYMDDIKIVCPDILSARKALKTLIIALRERGLSVNARKTDILTSDDPRIDEHLSEVSSDIQALDSTWNTRSRWSILRSLPALRDKAIQLISTNDTHSKDFRFCIRRLSWLAGCSDIEAPPDYFAPITSSLIEKLHDAPAATDEFVDYLSVAPLSEAALEGIAAYLLDPAFRIYTWQDYRLWLVILRQGTRNPRLIGLALQLVQSGEDNANRAGASLYLGRFGTTAEREVIARHFRTLRSFLGQRSAILAIQELPFHPVVKENVAPHIVRDLKGVYTILHNAPPRYFSEIEEYPVTKFIDGEAGYAS
jgi:hypothetical protein